MRRDPFFGPVRVVVAIVFVMNVAVFVHLKRSHAGGVVFFMAAGNAAADAKAAQGGQ